MFDYARVVTIEQLSCFRCHVALVAAVESKQEESIFLKFVNVLTFRWLFVFIVWFYKLFVSPIFPKTCIYTPSCSTFVLQALKSHGVIRGGVLGARRILSCHPFAQGGLDPVPDHFRGVVRWIL